MEHLHQQRRRVVLLLTASSFSCGLGGLGCIGDGGSTGGGPPERPPIDGGRVEEGEGVDRTAGADRGSGVDRGSGAAPTTAPCVRASDCPTGLCDRVSGLCLRQCFVSPDPTIVVTRSCREDEVCTPLATGSSACLRRCAGDFDCPTLRPPARDLCHALGPHGAPFCWSGLAR